VIDIRVGGDFKSITEAAVELGKIRDRDIPYVSVLSLNNLAFDAKESIDKEIAAKLNIKKRPLISSVRINKASKSKPYAKIFVDEWSWHHKVLLPHYFGGDRERKGLEKSMIYFGYMSRNEILTPPPGVTIKPLTYVKMISQLKLVYKSGYSANETKKSKFRNMSKKGERYFVIPSYKKSHLHPGIYARMSDSNYPVCMLRISKTPNYKKILTSFEDTAQKVHDRRKNIHLSEAIEKVFNSNTLKGWIK